MSEIDVISCLKKIKKKGLEQNKENLTNYLVKDYGYDKVNATESIERAVEDEAVKIVQFNGKDSYRVIAKDDTTILAPDSQSTELKSSDFILETECRQLINETAVENPTSNTEAVEKLFRDFVQSVENRLLAVADRLNGANLDVKSVENNSEEKDICFKILTNRVSELERQILEKDNVINFLTKQFANNNINQQDSPARTDKIRHNCRNFEELNSSFDNDVPLEQCNEKRSKKRENVTIIGDSMLNNINSRGLSKSKKVTVINHPGATSDVIEEELEATVKVNSNINTLIVHVGTNDLTNNINTLRSVKRICENTKKISPNTKIVFSSIIFRKDRRDIEKQRIDVNTRSKNFCKQKKLSFKFIGNSNLKEEYLGLKKLHLNRIGNSIFAKNFFKLF